MARRSRRSRHHRKLMTPLASEVRKVSDYQQHDPPVDARASLQANLSRPGHPNSGGGGGAGSASVMASLVDVGLGTVGLSLDTVMKFSSDVRDCMTTAEMVRQMAKGLSIKFIAVIGLTGAGKSSIIRTLTGKDVHVEHSIAGGTTSFAMYPTTLDGQRYVLVDTPGFEDADRSDTEVLAEILRWFETMSCYCTLAGILYVYDITQPRLTASAKLNLRMLQALCGPDFYPNVTVVTTKWGIMTDKAQRAAERRQVQLREEFWHQLVAGGARVFAYRSGVAEPNPDDSEGDDDDDDDEEKREQARADLEKMMAFYKTSQKITPEIQHELRRKHIHVHDTKAGREFLQPPQQQQQQPQQPQQQQPQQQQPHRQQPLLPPSSSAETEGDGLPAPANGPVIDDGSSTPHAPFTVPGWAGDREPFFLQPPNNHNHSQHYSQPAVAHLVLHHPPPHPRAESSAADPLLGPEAERGRWDARCRADPCYGDPWESLDDDDYGDDGDDVWGKDPDSQWKENRPRGMDCRWGAKGSDGQDSAERGGWFRNIFRAVWHFFRRL